MATYIQGLTDYVPQIQNFSPDYNFLSNILQTRQSRYDSGHKQLSNLYGTLLNSPMLRDENISRRGNFFKMINQDIQKISGMDLSLQQNVDKAMNVFKPFYEDKSMVKDMVWTKQLYNQMERGENFRTCIDPDKCGGQYWDGGMEALNWKAQEFKNASPEEALNFKNPTFTPYVNVMDKAMKAAKDAGFSVKFDEIKGGYIVTTKNGDRMITPLASFFTSKFGSDPQVTAYYKTQAYLERKNWVASNAAAYEGEDQATSVYMNNMMNRTREHVGTKKVEAEQEKQLATDRKNDYEKIIRRDGVLATDEDIINGYQMVNDASDTSEGNDEFYRNVDNLSGNVYQNASNFSAVADKFDELVGMSKLSNEMSHAASVYANLTMEQTMKADPYSLASFNSSLQLKNMMAGKSADFQYWKMKKEYEGELEKAKWDAFLGPDRMTPVPDAAGTGTKNEPGKAMGSNVRKLNELYNGANGEKITYVKDLVDALEQNSKTRGNYSNSLDNLTQIFKAAGLKNAYGLARNVLAGGEQRVNALNQLVSSGDKHLNKIYDAALTISDPSRPVWGTLNKSWNKSFWDKNMDQRTAINHKSELYKAAADWSHNQTVDIANKVSGELKNSGNDREASLAELMASETHNGIIPSSENWKENTARKWAREHADEFGASYGGEGTGGPQMVEDTRTGTFIGKSGDSFVVSGPMEPSSTFMMNNVKYKSREDNAYDWAMRNMDPVKESIQKKYLETANAWNHDDMFGMGTSGQMAMAYDGTFDPASIQRKGTMNMSELLRNYKSSGGSAKVAFGDATHLPEESNPQAEVILNQLTTDFFTMPGKAVKGRPNGNFRFQRIAGNDENTFAFTVYPSENWIKQYRGTSKNPQMTSGMAAGTGITVFLPHSAANNNLFAATEYNDYNFLLDKKGFLNIGDYPDAGNLELTKVGNQYAVRGYVNGLNPDGSLSKIEVNKTYNSDIEASVVYNDWSRKLSTLQDWIYNEKQALRATHGTRNPQELLNTPQE